MPKDKSSGKKLADMMYGNPEGAAFGVFPQMKRKRSKQDPEAAKNFPVDLARGVIAGAVGMPGDIESLARLPYELITGNESPTFLPTSEDVLKRIPFGTNTPAGQFASGLGTLAGGSANIGAAPRMVKKGALAAGRAGERMAERVVPQIMERGGAGADILSGLAQGSRANIVPPDLASKLSTTRSLPQSEIFQQAVVNTPGASITEEGLRMPLQRGQKIEQEMAPSVRGGVFYLPKGATQGKHYSKDTGSYGGSEKVTGETSIANPLFVKGATGGKAPEQAYIELMGKDAFKALQDELMGVLSYGNKNKRADVSNFLSKYAPELEDYADYIVDNSKQGNQLRYALQEAAIGSAARNAGHDAIVGYSKKKTGEPFISEVFDVREVNYPSQNIEPEVFEKFTQPKSEVHISDNPDVMQLEMAGGGLVRKGIKAIKGAAESAGQKAPVLAEKELTTLQDVHTSLGDRVRAGAMEAQKMMEGFDYKYDKGQRVFTKDSAGKNKPPYTILSRTRVGNQVMREDHPEFGQGMGRPIIDPETGKAMRTPYEPGYRVRMERSPDDWSEFEIPEKAIVGDVEMAAGGLVKGLKAAAKAAKAGADAPIVEAPSIIIPSKIQNVREAVRKSEGNYGAKRVERAADEIRNLERMYTEKALRDAFTGDNAKAVVTMNPADFEKYANILIGRTQEDIGPRMRELGKMGDINKHTVPTEEYIQHLMRVQGGFDQVPYLNLYKDEVGLPIKPEVRGHEGRHRNRALTEAGEPSALVEINPRGDLREGLPRRSQEEYIEALREELGLSDRLVLPQTDGTSRRPAIILPEPYAEGGEVSMAAGGLVKGLKGAAKAVKAVKGTQDVLPAAEREANKAKFLEPSAVKERMYHGTTANINQFKPQTGDAVFLTPDPKFANKFAWNDMLFTASPQDSGFINPGANVMPVHVQAKNPFDYENPKHIRSVLSNLDPRDKKAFKKAASEGSWQEIEKHIGTIQDTGFDSVFLKEMGRKNLAVFEPSQIKSAIGNRGTYDINDPDLNKADGGAVRMQAGGLAKAAKALKAAKEAPMKASEALGRVEGRPLVITQADRTKVGGGFLGGPGFSGLQLEDPAYRAAEAAWGVKTPGVAKMILGGGKAAGKDPVYAAMLGTPTQHQSNQMVFDKLYGDFKKSAKKGNLDPDLRDRINMRLANTVDKEGNPIFPPDVDILGKNFKELANTFDRRAVTANLIGGMGVGGKKGQIIDYDKIIRETTDPLLLDAPTGALGNRLFTLSGGIIDRPDLHPAFPTILQGEDLGVSFNPVARDLIMKDFMEQTMREKGRAPGYMDYTRGYPPSQLITEDLLTELQKLGLKEGGAVTKDEQSVQNPVHFTENPDAMRLALSKRN